MKTRNRFLSLVLTLALVFTCFAALPAYAADSSYDIRVIGGTSMEAAGYSGTAFGMKESTAAQKLTFQAQIFDPAGKPVTFANILAAQAAVSVQQYSGQLPISGVTQTKFLSGLAITDLQSNGVLTVTANVAANTASGSVDALTLTYQGATANVGVSVGTAFRMYNAKGKNITIKAVGNETRIYEGSVPAMLNGSMDFTNAMISGGETSGSATITMESGTVAYISGYTVKNGTSTINVTGGTVTGNILGAAGNGVSVVNVSNAKVGTDGLANGAIYGISGNFTGTTNITVKNSTVMSAVYGGGNRDDHYGTANIRVESSVVGDETYGNTPLISDMFGIAGGGKYGSGGASVYITLSGSTKINGKIKGSSMSPSFGTQSLASSKLTLNGVTVQKAALVDIKEVVSQNGGKTA